MVIFIVWKKPEVRGLTIFLFVNLAVTDLVVAVFLMPAVIFIFYYEGQWLLTGALGQVTCHLFFFLCFAVLSAPIVTHLAIAVDRFFAVLFPLRQLVHFRKAKILVPAIWLTTLFVLSPALLVSDLKDNVCSFEFEMFGLDSNQGSRFFYIYVTCVMYLIPLGVMTVLYGLICDTLRRHNRPGYPSIRAERRNNSNRKRVVRTLVTILTLFALCWLPANVNHILLAIKMSHPTATATCNWIGHAHSAINPWVCIALNTKMRSAFLRINRHCGVLRRNVDSPTVQNDLEKARTRSTTRYVGMVEYVTAV